MLLAHFTSFMRMATSAPNIEGPSRSIDHISNKRNVKMRVDDINGLSGSCMVSVMIHLLILCVYVCVRCRNNDGIGHTGGILLVQPCLIPTRTTYN